MESSVNTSLMGFMSGSTWVGQAGGCLAVMPDASLVADSPSRAIFLAAMAGIVASLAWGLGVLPLMIRQIDPVRHRGLG